MRIYELLLPSNMYFVRFCFRLLRQVAPMPAVGWTALCLHLNLVDTRDRICNATAAKAVEKSGEAISLPNP